MAQMTMVEPHDPEQCRRELLMMLRRTRRYLERFRNSINPDERKDFDKRIDDVRRIERKWSNPMDILR